MKAELKAASRRSKNWRRCVSCRRCCSMAQAPTRSTPRRCRGPAAAPAPAASPPAGDEQRRTLLKQLGTTAERARPDRAAAPSAAPSTGISVWRRCASSCCRTSRPRCKNASPPSKRASRRDASPPPTARCASTSKPADQALVDRDAGVIIATGSEISTASGHRLEELVKRYARRTATHRRAASCASSCSASSSATHRRHIGLGTLERPDRRVGLESAGSRRDGGDGLRGYFELVGLNGALYKEDLVEGDARTTRPSSRPAVDADGRWSSRARSSAPALADDKLRTALTYFFGPELVVNWPNPSAARCW